MLVCIVTTVCSGFIVQFCGWSRGTLNAERDCSVFNSIISAMHVDHNHYDECCCRIILSSTLHCNPVADLSILKLSGTPLPEPSPPCPVPITKTWAKPNS